MTVSSDSISPEDGLGQAPGVVEASPEVQPVAGQPPEEKLTGSRSKTYWVSGIVVVFLLALGLGIRIYDIADQPLDFHATRQLRGAIIARGMYYQLLPSADPEMRQMAINFQNSTGQYEPSILEWLSARTYLFFGHEDLSVPRLYSSIFWMIGGFFVYLLARRILDRQQITDSPAALNYIKSTLFAALVALAYVVILPFTVQASRSIQPDPLMVMWIVITAYLLYRWSETETTAGAQVVTTTASGFSRSRWRGRLSAWLWAILAGLAGGLGILTKVVAGYIIAGAAIALVIYALGVKRLWRNPRVWAMALMMLAPSVLYYYSRTGRAGSYFETWTISLSNLLLQPSFYVRWLNLVQDLVGFWALLLGVVGIWIARPRGRSLLLGLWIGYLAYGLFTPYQMYTHSYYHEQLVPIIGLSLAVVAQVVLERLFQQKLIWQIPVLGVFFVGLAFPAWTSIYTQARDDYRHEPAYWQQIASYLPTDGKIVALTQDYGYRLMYYGWRKVSLWPIRGEMTLAELRGAAKDFTTYFSKRTEGRTYFLITAFGQLNDQPELKKMLAENYTLVAQGDGYLIYDLTRSLQDNK